MDVEDVRGEVLEEGESGGNDVMEDLFGERAGNVIEEGEMGLCLT